MVVGLSSHAGGCKCCVMCIWVVLCVTMRWSEDDEVIVGYTGVARNVISPGRSCMFFAVACNQS